MLLVSLTIVAGVTGLSYFLSKSMLYPSVVYAALWSLQLLGLLLFGDRFIAPSAEALLVVVLGAFVFAIGSFLSLTKIDESRLIANSRRVKGGLGAYLLAAIVVAICLHGQYQAFADLGYNLDFAATLVYARTLVSVEDQDIYSLYKYGSPVAMGCLILLQLLIINNEAKLSHKLLFVFFLLASLFMGVLSTGRGPVILVFLLLITTYLFRVGLNWRIRLISVGVLFPIFMIFWIMGKVMGKADDLASGAAGEFADYFFSSIPALSVYLKQHPLRIMDGDFGGNTFRFFIAVAAALGLADRPRSLVQDFVGVPHMTNLYTIYFHYVKDFGLIGVILIPLFLGFVHGRIFRWAMVAGIRERSDFAIYILSLSYLPLLQAIFQESHFTSLSTWIQFVVVGILMTRRNSLRTIHGF